jgi:hypothetical protein
MNLKHDLRAPRLQKGAASRRPEPPSLPTMPLIKITRYQRLLDDLELRLPPEVRINQSHASYGWDGVDVEVRWEDEGARICIAAHIGTARPTDELKVFHALLAHQLELTTPAFMVVGWDRDTAAFYVISHHYPGDAQMQLEPFVAHLGECVYTARVLRGLCLPDVNDAQPNAARLSPQPVNSVAAHLGRGR